MKTVDISVSGTRQEMEEISSQFSKESESEELLFRNVNVNILLFLMFKKKHLMRGPITRNIHDDDNKPKIQLSQQQQQLVNGRNRQLQQQQQIRSLFGQHQVITHPLVYLTTNT